MKYPIRVELSDGPMLVFEDGHLEPVGDVNIVPGPDPIPEMDASEIIDPTPDPELGRPKTVVALPASDGLDDMSKNELLAEAKKAGVRGVYTTTSKDAIKEAIRAVK
jgi:hypothetical protein